MIIAKFTDKPSAPCYKNAVKHKVILYQRVNRDIESDEGLYCFRYIPFVFGFSVYEQLHESCQWQRPGKHNAGAQAKELEGGHAVLAVGYDDAAQCFIVRNSWGTGWGIKGYFTAAL